MPRRPQGYYRDQNRSIGYFEDDDDYEDEYEYEPEQELLGPTESNDMIPNPWVNNNSRSRYSNPQGSDEYKSWDWQSLKAPATVAGDYYNYDYDSGDYLKDNRGRYYYVNKRGDPSDPNYFWNPHNRQTLSRVPNRPDTDFLYNKLGYRGSVDPRYETKLNVNPHSLSGFVPTGDKEVDDETMRIMGSDYGFGSNSSEHLVPSHESGYPPSTHYTVPSQVGSGSSGNFHPSEYSDHPDFFDGDDRSLQLSGYPAVYSGSQMSSQIRNQNFIQSAPQRSSKNRLQPTVRNVDEYTISYSNYEYICDLASSTATNITTAMGSMVNYQGAGYYVVPCNAGIWSSFPMLSQCACTYQYYKFKKLKFHYVTTSSDSLSSTDTALGQVTMTFLMNVDSSYFVSKQQMQNNGTVITNKPSVNSVIEIPVNESIVKWYYTRYDPNTVNGYLATANTSQSLQLFDQANFFLSVLNSQASNYVGQLWAEYECEMSMPYLFSNVIGNNILYWRWITPLYSGSNINNFTSNLVEIQDAHGNLAMNLQYVSEYTFKLNFPPTLSYGIYRVTMVFIGAVGAVGVGQNAGTFNCFNNLGTISGNVNLLTPYNYSSADQITELCSTGSSMWQSINTSTGFAYSSGLILTLGGADTCYVQVTGPNAFLGVSLDFNKYVSLQVPGTVYQMCMAVEQCNPDFLYPYSKGYYPNS